MRSRTVCPRLSRIAFVASILLATFVMFAGAVGPDDAMRVQVQRRSRQEPTPLPMSGTRGNWTPGPERTDSSSPLYKRFPPERVIVGDVDGKYLLTRAELEKRVRLMAPSSPGRRLDAFEREQSERRRVQMEGQVLDEWAVLKALVRQAELAGVRVPESKVDKALHDLMSGDGQGDAGSGAAPRGVVLGFTEAELREQVADAALIDAYLTKFIEKEYSDKQLKDIYDRHRAQYSEPQAYHVRQIFRRVDPAMGKDEKKDLRKAFYKLRKKAARKGGRDFEKIAREESDSPNAKSDGGDMGWIDFTLPMDAALSKAIIGLDVGEVSRIIETSAGLHIVRVEERRPARGTTWDDFARKRVIDRVMFDMKNRQGPALLRTVPFSVRLNTSGLRLTTDPRPTPKPASAMRPRERSLVRESDADDRGSAQNRRRDARRQPTRR